MRGVRIERARLQDLAQPRLVEGAAEEHVVEDRARDDERTLRHGRQRRRGAHAAAAHEALAARRGKQRRLARADCAHHRDHLAAAHREAHAL